MSRPEVGPLAAFLLLRNAERETAAFEVFVAELTTEPLSAEVRAYAYALWDKASSTALLRLDVAVQAMFITGFDALGRAGEPYLRRRAAVYADHPQYPTREDRA